jgi:hypothetical protein
MEGVGELPDSCIGRESIWIHTSLVGSRHQYLPDSSPGGHGPLYTLLASTPGIPNFLPIELQESLTVLRGRKQVGLFQAHIDRRGS